MPARSDAALWQAARTGQLSAFGRLYRRHIGTVSALLLQRFGAAAPVDDMVAGALLRLWRRWDRLETNIDLPALWYRAALEEAGLAGDRLVGAPPSADAAVDPVEAQLLYVGAGLPLEQTCRALHTTPERIIEALASAGATRPIMDAAR